METFLGIMIPFLGTTLGAACVFFMKKSLGDVYKRQRYCLGVHGTRGGALCPACNALLEYARQRRERCPHGEIDSHE